VEHSALGTRRQRIRVATPGDIAGIARVHVDAWRETYPGMFPAFVLDALSYAEREEQWTDALTAGGSCLFVAEVDEQIVGFAAGGPNREDLADEYPGELWAIYLLQAAQGRGLGRVLFEAVRGWLRVRELEPFLLWAVADNPACGFYERLGGTRIVTQPADIRGAQVIECAYAWPRSALPQFEAHEAQFEAHEAQF
jgi:GNAT superfamily N-acetyltransferase